MKNPTRVTGLIITAVVLSPLIVMAIYVEDWSRDLTTNRAHTAPGQKNEPWELPNVSAEQVARAAENLARTRAAWRLADEKPLPPDSPLPDLLPKEAIATHHFVRTTGLMRYRDDLWLVVANGETPGSLTLYAESRSRVGKGDLGQNPRNLAELRAALAAALP